MLQVKLFDCEHEADLEEEINHFLEELEPREIVDIKYDVAILGDPEEEQVYCFSAMIIYRVPVK